MSIEVSLCTPQICTIFVHLKIVLKAQREVCSETANGRSTRDAPVHGEGAGVRHSVEQWFSRSAANANNLEKF